MAIEARRNEYGKLFHIAVVDVALDTGENITDTVTFDVAYPTTPAVRVIPHLGTGGAEDGEGGFANWKADAVSETGFTWNITNTGLGDVTVPVTFMAHEQS